MLPTHSYLYTHDVKLLVDASWTVTVVVIPANLVPQTGLIHVPFGLLIASSLCACECVYPASSSSCVRNSSLSCGLMTELRERDSNMGRCLTPFSPDLETTGQTLCIILGFFTPGFACVSKGPGRARERETYRSNDRGKYPSPYISVLPLSHPFPWQLDPTHNQWSPSQPLLTHTHMDTQRQTHTVVW